MTYHDLIRAVQAGDAPDLATIGAILAGAGKTEADLVAAAFTDPPPRRRQPCGVCCRGRLVVKNTRRAAGSIVRYLACNKCGARPARNKLTGPTVPTD